MFLEKIKAYFAPDQQLGLRVGRVLGIEIWFHWWLVVVIAIQLFYYLFALGRWTEAPHPVGHWFLFLITLPGSLLLHEIGHLIAARREEGGTNRFVLSPVGGLQPCEAPVRPESQFRVAAGGFALSGVLLAGGMLICWAADWAWLPFNKSETGFVFHRLLVQYLVLWNAFLLIVNLLPCFPMDAGQLVHARVWARMGSHPRATLATLKLSRVCAISGLVVAALIFVISLGNKHFSFEHPLINNLVMGLLLVGFLHFVEARKMRYRMEHGEEEQGIFGYDFSEGYTSLEQSESPETRKTTSQRARRREHKQRQIMERKRQEDREVHARLDQLLEKIHRDGMESLTREEKRFLKRASRHVRESKE